jgi:hypothetical protein
MKKEYLIGWNASHRPAFSGGVGKSLRRAGSFTNFSNMRNLFSVFKF